MNAAAGPRNPALSALLDHIGGERDRECADIARKADDAARVILRNARHAARLRVRHALAAQRADVEIQCIAAKAAADKQLRSQRQQLARRVLDQAWSLLQNELSLCWANPCLRAQWVRDALDTARLRLVGRDWIVACPATWPEVERAEALVALLQKDAAISVQWQAENALSMGLHIATSGSYLDASAKGLLVQRELIEGWLLAELERSMPAGAGGKA